MYPTEVSQFAQMYGFKAANLTYLQKLFSQQDSSIIIPSFIPVSNRDIIEHLNHYAPEWNSLWAKFKTSIHEKDIIDAKSEEILNQLQSVIKTAFIEHMFIVNCSSQSSLLMVRSSGNEDGEDIANPGGNESAPSLNEPQKISFAIGQVVASYFSLKSMGQRLKSGEKIDDSLPTMACLIQDFVGEYSSTEQLSIRRIMPPVSGVIYTYFGNTHIQAAPGHGELVVNSLGYSDDYYVTRENSVYTVVREKKFRLASEFNPDTNTIEFKRKDNPIELAISASLSEEIAIEISQAARIIENAYGIRMDIEFVYHPTQKKIAIVQARPIVDVLTLKNLPNSISKDFIAQHPDMVRTRGEILTLSVMNIHIINHRDEILVCDTINQALAKWIQHRDIIKGVVVCHYAPSTSHEVGMFNSKGIPVLQVNDLNAIQRIITSLNGRFALIFDPQNSSIFQVSSQDLDNKEQNGLIQEGLCHSVLTHHVTLPKRTEQPIGETAILMQNLIAFLHEQAPLVRKKYNSLQEIKEDLNQLSFISSKEEIKNKLKINLANLVLFAYDSRLRKKGAISPELFAKIVETAALLFDKIEKQEPMNDAEKNRISTIEYLNILKKFEGLFVSKKKVGIISSSIFRELSQASRARLRLEPIGLKSQQLAYYDEFVKLCDYIVVKERGCEWVTFCEDVCKLDLGSKLAELVGHLVRQDIHQFWLNYYFYKVKKEMPDKTSKDLLEDFCRDMDEFVQHHDLFDVSRRIDQLENQIDLWGMPENFEKLFLNFDKEITFIDEILRRNEENFLSYMSTFKLMDKFVDVLDRSIKSLQHGQYPMQQKSLQVERFRMMLSEFLKILEKRFVNWAPFEELNKAFYKIKDNHEIQLDVNPAFNVPQANPFFQSDINIYRAFTDQHSLADIHSVIHQTFICLNAKRFVNKAKDIMEYFPLKMKDVIEKMKKLPYLARTPMILCDFQFPEIMAKFNIPLSNHAAQIFIIYNVDEESFRIKLEGYGGAFKSFWHRCAEGILGRSSETNALINCLYLTPQGCNFDAIVRTPDECFRLFQAFSDYLPGFLIGKENAERICSEMPSDFQPLSSAIMQIFSVAKTFDKLKKLYLTQEDRALIRAKIMGYNIPQDKKDILLTYNGMALIKAGDIDESQAQVLEPDKLEKICSDAVMSVYIYPDVYFAIQNLPDEKILESLTSIAARTCYEAGASFAQLYDLFEDNKDKFFLMTSVSALWAYFSGATFPELLLLEDDDLESMFKHIKNPYSQNRSHFENQELIKNAVIKAQEGLNRTGISKRF